MRKEREKGATAPGGAPRRDRPGGRARAAAAGGGKGSRTKAQLAAHSKIEGEEPDDEPEDEAMQDAVSGSEDRFTDADEVITTCRRCCNCALLSSQVRLVFNGAQIAGMQHHRSMLSRAGSISCGTKLLFHAQKLANSGS